MPELPTRRYRQNRGGGPKLGATAGRQRSRGPGKGTGGNMNHWLARAVTAVLAGDRPADLALREVFAAHRQIGSRDRRRIADRCFLILRHRRSLAYALEEAGLDAKSVPGMLALADKRFAPALLSGSLDTGVSSRMLEAAALVDLNNAPLAVQLDLPDWLLAELASVLGEQAVGPAALSLLDPGTLDLRVNLARHSREQVRNALQKEGIDTVVPDDGAMLCPESLLRVLTPAPVEQTVAFQSGLFEVQDAGSQQLARIAGPKRQQTIVDFCAGAGGKTLAMADITRDTGNLYACDTAARRLSRMQPRLGRAGLQSVRPLAIESESDPRLARLTGRADLVFVDAPCSGTGTIRRSPDLKWRLRPEDLTALVQKQRNILAAASALVRPGGRLVYATCSLLACENEAVAMAFEASNPTFRREDLASRFKFRHVESKPALGVMQDISSTGTGFLRFWPHIDGCDGYFIAAWTAPRGLSDGSSA